MRNEKTRTNENDDTEDLDSTEDDNDDEIDTPATEEEWIEYVNRNRDEAIEKMENAKIRCWMKTHKRMKWWLALRNASLPSGEMDSETCWMEP